MQANRMRADFDLQVEGAQLGNRIFNDREVSDFLSKSQTEVTKRRFTFDKNRRGKGFAADLARQADLAGLISAHTAFTRANDDFVVGTEDNGALRTPDLDQQNIAGSTAVLTDYGVFCRIPNEVLYILLETCELSKSSTIAKNIPTKEVNHLQYSLGITNYHEKPYGSLVWTMDWGSFTTSGSNSDENSTKYGDTNVDPTATPVDPTGFAGTSSRDGVTAVSNKYFKK